MSKLTAEEQRQALAARLDRIDEKIDKMADAVIALARAEEKIITLTSFSKQQSEQIQNVINRGSASKYFNYLMLGLLLLSAISSTNGAYHNDIRDLALKAASGVKSL